MSMPVTISLMRCSTWIRLLPSCLEAFLEFLSGSGDPHSSPATTKGSLQKYGESDFSSFGQRFLGGLNFLVCAWDNWDPCGLRQLLGFKLVRYVAKDFAAWTYENEAGLFAGLSEVCVLCEKPVSWVDRLHAGFLGCFHDLCDVEVALSRRARTYLIGFVCARDVFGL